MKVLTWNVGRAGPARTELWELIADEGPDIILLQEVTGVPTNILDAYACHLIKPRYFGGSTAPYCTGVLARGTINATPFLVSELDWVNKIHAESSGWFVECEITIGSGELYRVVSVHSPAGPIPKNRWASQDVSGLKLTKNPDLWFTEILWSLLGGTGISRNENWVVAGDFNSSVLFDIPSDRGNQEVISRLNALGLFDALSYFQGKPVPTFQDTRKQVKHQLDYCYINESMLKRLINARAPSPSAVFSRDTRLSDHLPVICEIEASGD